MKNTLKVSLFAIALGLFASCGDQATTTDSTTTPAANTEANATLATPAEGTTAAPAGDSTANTAAAPTNTAAPADTTKK
jgi:hypothetical protein